MLTECTRSVLEGRSLTSEESSRLLDSILSGEGSDTAIASFLTALSIKGETSEEISGFARAMRKHCRTLETTLDPLVDTAGTGGGKSTFNISTAAAFVIAGAGYPVAKHGNRAVTSRSGSADVLEALGVNVTCSWERSRRCLEEIGVAFLFAPAFHPAMKRVARIRQQLAHRTVFNMLGPLANPAGAPCQLIGVYSSDLVPLMAEALSSLGCRRAWVVHGLDGLDEISLHAPTLVADVNQDQVSTFQFEPGPAGFSAAEPLPPGGSPTDNARLIRDILGGNVTGAALEVVLLNAAVAVHLADELTLQDAIGRCRETLTSGAALAKLDSLVELTREKT